MEYVTMIVASQITALKVHKMDSLAWSTSRPWPAGTGLVLASTAATMLRWPAYTMRGLVAA